MNRISVFLLSFLFSIVSIGSLTIKAEPMNTSGKTEEHTKVPDVGLQELSPKLMISSYEITEGQLIPGEEFTVKLVIQNTNPYVGVENTMLSYSSTDTMIYPVFGESNQAYVGKIAGGASSSVELHMKVAENIKSDVAIVGFTMEYASSFADYTEATASIILPVSANCKMVVNTLSVAQSSTIGSKSLVSVAYSNTGLTEIKNVTMFINGDILASQKAIVLGDLAAGSQGMKDCYVNFQTEGEQKLLISFTYEDDKGMTFRIPEAEYTTLVNSTPNAADPEISPEDTNNEEQNSQLELWQWMAIGGGVVIVLIIILIVIKIKNRRRF